MKKSMFSRCAWLISGMACVALCFRPLSWLFCALMACVLLIRNRAVCDALSCVCHTKTSRILAGILCLFFGWGFRGAWMHHHLVQTVVEKLPLGSIDGGLLITICSLIGMAAGYPFASAAVSFFCHGQGHSEEQKTARMNEKGWFHLSLGMAAAVVLIQIVGCFSDALWFDEAFSMAAIKLPWREMLDVIVQDVHPPLYYLILKAGVDVLRLIIPGASLIELAKLVSVIPHVCLLILGATVVRKRFNPMTSAIFMALLLVSPSFLSFGYEIRMYSWAMLFVAAAYLAADRVIRNGGFAQWAGFVMFSLLGAYTHYYAVVAAALLYLYMLCRFALCERRRVVHWLLGACATVVGYCPWLIVFLKQAKSVSEAYWIGNISFDVFSHIEVILDTPYVWLAVFAAIVSLGWMKKQEKGSGVLSLVGLFSPLWIIAVGMAASVLIRPVFISRYALLSLPCFLLSVAAVLGTQADQTSAQRIAALLIGVCLCNSVALFVQEKKMEGRAERITAFAQEWEDRVFLTDEAYLGLTVGEVTGKTCYHFNTRIKERDRWMFDVFAQAEVLRDAEEIHALLDEGR